MANVYLQDEKGNEIALDELSEKQLGELKYQLIYKSPSGSLSDAEQKVLREAQAAVRKAWADCTETNYKIVRMYKHGGSRTIRTNVTLREAQAHCRNPETSSSTATSAAAKAVTRRNGAWFDGYEEM